MWAVCSNSLVSSSFVTFVCRLPILLRSCCVLRCGQRAYGVYDELRRKMTEVRLVGIHG